jgi:Leucine-rich repeat (LRR) protein
MSKTGVKKETKKQAIDYNDWWNGLTNSWKQAFNEVLFQKKDASTPSDEQLKSIWELKILRMAGPTAMFPNVGVTLDDLSGISRLTQLEILVVTNHNLETIDEVANLINLNSLFVFSNKIKVLRGVEKLKGLKKLYFNDNQVSTLQALSNMTSLETLHCANNKITSLKGIGKQHKDLKEFFCLPNEGIWQSEIMRFETEVQIRCLKG